jgi:pimeloyl-ACP methyl ester carboxylesterase
MKLSLTVHEQSVKEAPYIVMIHGMGSAATAWKPLIPHLEERFNLVAVDLPGHGRSPLNPDQLMDPKSLARLVVKNLEHELGIQEFHVVGNSWGGWVGLEIAALFPDRVRSVNALAPAGFWLATFNQRFPGHSLMRGLANNTKALAPTFLKYEWARKFGFEDVSPQWRDFSVELCLDATYAMAASPGYFPAWDGMLKKRFDSQIDASIPVKIIFGDSDKTLPAVVCQERSMSPAHAEWIILEQSGHAPMWDNPAAVASHIFELANKNT